MSMTIEVLGMEHPAAVDTLCLGFHQLQLV